VTPDRQQYLDRDPEALDFYLAMQFIIDHLAADLLEGELRVLLFITRQTSGWGKVRDTISIAQIMNGIKNRNGTGMRKAAVIRSYKSLQNRGLIRIIKPPHKGGLPLTFDLTLPINEPAQARTAHHLRTQTQMSPLEPEPDIGNAPGKLQEGPKLALVGGRHGTPKRPRSRRKVVSQRVRPGTPKGPRWSPKDTESGIPKRPRALSRPRVAGSSISSVLWRRCSRSVRLLTANRRRRSTTT
jgi:hypothetical protein